MNFTAAEVSFFLHRIHQLNEQLVLGTEASNSEIETFISLSELEQCLKKPHAEIAEALEHLLALRWERIRGSDFCYTYQPEAPINALFIELAHKISPLPQEIDELPEGQGPYFKLMPSLRASKDVYGFNLHHYSLSEVILSDDEKAFIPIVLCLDDATKSDSGVFRHLFMIDGSQEFNRPLTTSEREKLIAHSSLVAQCFNAVECFNQMRIHGSGLRAAVQRLIRDLRAGGVHRGGEEFNAGSSANVGIVNFLGYWKSLPKTTRESSKNKELSEVLNRLTRSTEENYTNTRYCVELIANDLENLKIEDDSLNSLSQHLKKIFELLTEGPIISDKTFPAKTPKVLMGIKNLLKFQHSTFLREWLSRNLMEALGTELPDFTEYDDLIQEYLTDSSELIKVIKRGYYTLGHYLIGKGVVFYLRNEEGDNAFDVAQRYCPSLLPDILTRALLMSEDEQIELLANEGRYTGVWEYVLEKNPMLLGKLIPSSHSRSLKEKLQIARIEGKTTMLHMVCSTGDTESVKKLIRLGADIEAQCVRGMTSLHTATEKGHRDILMALIKAGANIEALTNIRRTPLICAAIVNQLESARCLLTCGANLNAQDADKDTALTWAIYKNNQEIAKLLIQHGADITVRNRWGENALDIAHKRAPDLIEPLLLKAAELDSNQQEELLSTVIRGIYKNILHYVVAQTPHLIQSIVHQYHPAFFGALLHRNERYQKDNTFLHIAAHLGHTQVVKICIAHGLTIDEPNNVAMTALHLSAIKGHSETISTLIEAGANIEAESLEKNTPLIVAATNNQVGAAQCLLDSGANINAQNADKDTALTWAIYKYNSAVVELLLRQDADIKLRNKRGKNALDIALKHAPGLVDSLLLKAALTLSENEQKEFLSQVDEGKYDTILSYIGINKPELLGQIIHLYSKDTIIRTLASVPLLYANENLFHPFAIQLELTDTSQRQYLNDLEFDLYLEKFKIECEKISQKNQNKMAVAQRLIEELFIAKLNFLTNSDASSEIVNQKRFLEHCIRSIDSAVPVLGQLPVWKLLLYNFLILISLGIASLILPSYGFFKTSYAKELSALKMQCTALHQDLNNGEENSDTDTGDMIEPELPPDLSFNL